MSKDGWRRGLRKTLTLVIAALTASTLALACDSTGPDHTDIAGQWSGSVVADSTSAEGTVDLSLDQTGRAVTGFVTLTGVTGAFGGGFNETDPKAEVAPAEPSYEEALAHFGITLAHRDHDHGRLSGTVNGNRFSGTMVISTCSSATAELEGTISGTTMLWQSEGFTSDDITCETGSFTISLEKR